MIEAMKLALESLEDWKTYMRGHWDVIDEQAVTALRQAIAEAKKQDGDCQRCGGKGCVACDAREQEPVAWGIANTRPTERNPLMMVMLDEPAPSHLVIPLYTHPPKREWVGLEPKDMPDGEDPMYDHPFFTAGMVWAANKLKEKNT